jgi:photosystem II stability/assembly factor-like uncharacterized protein
MKSHNRIQLNLLLLVIVSALFTESYSQDFSWNQQNSGTFQWLNDIHFTDRVHGWATGTNGAIVATVDGGENWFPQNSVTDQELRSVYFVNQDTGWIAGGSDSPVLLKTTDGGTQWSLVEIDMPGVPFFSEIQFADPMNGYAIDTTDIFRTYDGGLTWETASYSSLVAEIIVLEDLHVISDSEAFVCGIYRNKSNEILPGIFENLTLPDGRWLPQGSGELQAEDRLTAIHFTAYRKGFSGSSGGKIYTMQKEGNIFPAPWVLNLDALSGAVQSIAFSTYLHGMFNLEAENGGMIDQLIFHTADSGYTWSAVPDTIYGLQRATLSAPDANHAWIAGSNGIIYKGERTDPVSVSQFREVEISIMPNPFTFGIVVASPASLRNSVFELFDYTGKKVHSGRLDGEGRTHTLTGLESLNSGVYFLRILHQNRGVGTTKKIIKH